MIKNTQDYRWSLSVINAKLRPVLESLEKVAEELDPLSRLYALSDLRQIERDYIKKDSARLKSVQGTLERLEMLEGDFKKLECIMANMQVIIDSNTRTIINLDKEAEQ